MCLRSLALPVELSQDLSGHQVAGTDVG